jgi:cytochrome c1
MFLSNSIDETAHNLLDINTQNYTINGEEDGVCFLNEIITKSYVDTNATVDTIRKSISRLGKKIKEFKFDIKVFNTYVQTQVKALQAHGIPCTELLTILFLAYNQVQDQEFQQQVRLYCFQYTSASVRGENRDISKEMRLVMEQSYHRRMEEGTWNPKQIKTDKERIIALETTITELKAAPAAEKTNNNNSGNDKWAWKKIPRSSGAAHTIKKDKKEYLWYPKHKAWTIHRPEACRVEPNTAVANETTTETENQDDDDRSNATTVSAIRNDPELQSIVGNGRVFS